MPSLSRDINKFPAIKEHLLSFGYDRLKQTGEGNSRKKSNNKWFETQDSISYRDDFFKPKIIYPEITKYLNFYYDQEAFFVNNKCFILTGEHIFFLTAFLNSSLFKFCFRNNFPELLGGTRELRKIFFEKISIKKVNNDIDNSFKKILLDIQHKKALKEQTLNLETKIDNLIFDIYELTNVEKNSIGFIEIE